MKNLIRVLSALLFVSIVLISGIHGALLQSFLSLVLLILLCVMAFPAARLLFADRTLAIVFVFPIGYVIHAVFLSLCGLFFGINKIGFILYFLVCAIVFVFFTRTQRSPEAEERPFQSTWESSDTVLLLLWLLMTIAIVAFPFWNVGIETESGFAYRAYFNADFFRNMAVTGSLSNAGIPPDNPYVSGFVLRYYWFFHILPSYWEALFPSYRLDFLMVQFSLFSVCAFTASLFAAVRTFAKSHKTLVLLFPVFAFGGSYEGLYILWKLKQRNLPWSGFTQWNVDGILRWLWNAPQIDTLYRALLYAPQHLLGLAVFLIVLVLWQKPISRNARLLLFGLMFASVGISVFIGAAMVIVFAALMIYETVRNPAGKWLELVSSGILGIAFLAAYLGPFGMFQTQAGQLLFGPDPVILKNFAAFFVLNWGALLWIGAAGLAFSTREFPVRILACFLIVCFFLILFVKLNLPGGSDVSLKMGHFSHVVLLMLGAAFIDRIFTMPARNRWLVPAVCALVFPALLTWWMDAYNSRDIENQKFTTLVNKDDASIYAWMKSELPKKTVVQNFAVSDTTFLRGFVSEIPPFAERSLFLGDRNFSRIFEVPLEQVDQRKRIVSQLVREQSTERLWQRAKDLGISYFFCSSQEVAVQAHAQGVLVEPQFSVMIQQGNSLLYRVNEKK